MNAPIDWNVWEPMVYYVIVFVVGGIAFYLNMKKSKGGKPRA